MSLAASSTGQHGGQAGGGELADAVADAEGWTDPALQQCLSQRVGHREQRRLREAGVIEAGIVAEYRREQVRRQVRVDGGRHGIEMFPVHGIGVVERPRHARVLGALP